jgi:hypothetical protein
MDESISELTGGLKRAWSRLAQLSGKLLSRTQTTDSAEFDIQSFIEQLKIVNKRGELVSLIMNRSQEIVFEKLMECREQQRPARFICCKARQLGISTLIEAFVFALITRNLHRSALLVAHSIDSASLLFSMIKRFHTHLPPFYSKPLARSNARLIEYPQPGGSRLRIDTASNKNLGRGGTIHYVHASEVAFWDKPEDPILAINQAVPQHWDTLIFWESTANGRHNLFHRTWIAAERGESDMEPIFLSWKGFPEYSLPVAPRENLQLTSKESSYAAKYALTKEQVKWASHTRENQCHNSWDKFHQEYPVSAHLAFAFTGMPWFDPDVLHDMLENLACAPVKQGYLKFVWNDSNIPEFVEQERGPLKVWTLPDPSKSYSLGMDVGEGVGADYTVIQVICNETGELVASYRSNRIRAESAGVDAYLLGSWYNYGLLGIERNGPGLATLAVVERGLAEYPQITGYPNLYYHTWTDRKIPEETRRLGWITNRATKEAMLTRLAQSVESRTLQIFSKTTLLEMQGFVWDAEKKTFKQNYVAPDSRLSHDDEIMALAIANEMRTQDWENRFIPGGVSRSGQF